MPAVRPILIALLLIAAAYDGDSAEAARNKTARPATRRSPGAPRAPRRTSASAMGRRSVLPRLRIDYSLARFRPRSYLTGSTVGVSGPIDPDNPRVEASIFADAETGWRYQIRFKSADFDAPPRRLSRARRLELHEALRKEVASTPVLAEPLAYLIADLGIAQPPLAQPIDLDGFTMVSADSLPGEGGLIRAFRFRGFAGDRLLEIEMAFEGGGGRPAVRVRRWKPAGSGLRDISRGRARGLERGELESLERILIRRAGESRNVFDPSGLAGGILKQIREASAAADH